MKTRTAVVTAVLVVLVAIETINPARAYAASAGPTNAWVLIAYDATQGHCFYKQGAINIPCPLGSIINTKRVRIAEAQARGIPYVTLPVMETALSMQQDAQIHQLVEQTRMVAKGVFAVSASPLLVTGGGGGGGGYFGCGHGGTSPDVYWYPNWSSGQDTTIEYDSTVTYSVSSDCTQVTITDSQINTVKNSEVTHWDADLYAGSRWPRQCSVIPGNTPNHRGLLFTGASNYTWEQVVGDGCAPYNNTSYFDVWRLN